MRNKKQRHTGGFWRMTAGAGASVLIAAGLLSFRFDDAPFGQAEPPATASDHIIYTDGIPLEEEKRSVAPRIEALYHESAPKVIGLADVVYQDESYPADLTDILPEENSTAAQLAQLRDIAYLKSNFYNMDKTDMPAGFFDVDQFMAADLSVQQETGAPTVLLFHTHASELYADSANADEGIVGVGRALKELLEEKYGLSVLHVTERFDLVNGKTSIRGAYERMEPRIEAILAETPSIELAIDLHRDGLMPETPKLLTTIDGKPTAKIMFVNGLSMILNSQGVLEDVAELPNANLPMNLALSFRLQLAANSLYPGFARKILLKGYRYSLHMLPKSVLIEVGANTNTKEEAFNTVEPLADMIANVVLRKTAP